MSMLVLFASMLVVSEAFVPFAPLTQPQALSVSSMMSSSSKLSMMEPSSTMQVAVGTLDPTTFLSDILGAVVGTPLILAVPILAALGVAGLLAFLIVSYANPEVEDDEI